MDDNNMLLRAGLLAVGRPGPALSPPYPIGRCHSYIHRPGLLLKLPCSREERTRLPRSCEHDGQAQCTGSVGSTEGKVVYSSLGLKQVLSAPLNPSPPNHVIT